MFRLTALFVVTGAALIGLAIPLMRRRVPPNALYGLRVRSTFADEWVWYEANASFGRDLLRLGALIVVAALLLPLVPGLLANTYGKMMMGLMVVGVVWVAVLGWRRGNGLLQERSRGTDDAS